MAVNADGPTAFGPYRLRAEKLKPYDGKPLAGSGEIVDMLASNSQDYTLQVDKAGLYEIRLVSDAFDPVLKLSGQGVDAENDDGGDSTNSRLTLSLKPGKYTLTARGLGDGVSGMFTLSANRIELPGNLVDRDGTALPKSGSVYTMLDNDGVRRFLLTLDRPTNVRLDAISGQVDTVLRVVGGDVELTDDDGGNDTNARRKKRCLPVITPSRCPASATARAWWKCVCRWTAPAPMGLLLRRQVPLPTRPLLRPMMPPRWKLPAVERVPHSVGCGQRRNRKGRAMPGLFLTLTAGFSARRRSPHHPAATASSGAVRRLRLARRRSTLAGTPWPSRY